MSRLISGIIISVALMMFSACMEEVLSEDLPCGGEQMSTVRISVGSGTDTRAVDETEDDAKINRYQVIVFLVSTGEKKAYCNSEDGSPLSLSVPKGTRLRFCVVANTAEDLSKVKTFSQFSGKRSNYLDNTLDNMEMIGVYETTVTGDGDIFIPVERFMCKITCKELYYYLECGYTEVEGGLECAPFLYSIFLYNVPSDCPYSFAAAPTGFLSPVGSYESYLDKLFTAFAAHQRYYVFREGNGWSTPTNKYSEYYKRVQNGERLYNYDGFVGNLYCYPNLLKYSGQKYRTQLVFEFVGNFRTVDGYQDNHRHYFTFILPELENNTEYVLNTVELGMNGVCGYPLGTTDFPLSIVADCEMQTRSLSTGEVKDVKTIRQVMYEKVVL